MATDYSHQTFNEPAIDTDILLVHGALSNKNYWLDNESLMSEFKRLKPRSITAISLMGRGKSSLSNECSVNSHIAEIKNIISKLNLRNITLVSHSFGTAVSVGVLLEESDRIKKFVGGDYFPIIPPFSQGWLKWVNENINDFDIDNKLPECLVRDITRVDYRDDLKKLNIRGLMLRGTKDGAMLSDENLAVWSKFEGLSHFATDTGHNVYSSPLSIETVSNFILAP